MIKERSAEQVWNDCLEIIKDNLSGQNFKTWFEPIKAIKIQHKKVLEIKNSKEYIWEQLLK